MPVGSPLEMYTTVLGWHIYNGFWDLIAHTGLVLIPFGWMALNNMVEARKSASKTDVGIKAFRRTEVELITAFFVMFLFAVPSIHLRTATVKYIHSSCELNGTQLERTTQSKTFGATRSTYDQNVGEPIIAILDGSQPGIPPVWYLMASYMRAIPEALKQTLPCNPDLRLLATDLQNAAIQNLYLRDELAMFQRDCWHPSVNQFLREKPEIPGGDDKNIKRDISWAGSNFFLQTPGYYDSFRVKEPLKSFSYDQVRDETKMTPEHAQGRGMPYCREWWQSPSEGLRERLLTDADMESNLNWRYLVRRAFGQDERQARDALLYTILSMDTKVRANKLTNAYPRDTFLGSKALGRATGELKASAATAGLAAAAPILYTGIFVIKQAAPIFQAVILMFIVAMLPVLLTISGFQIKPAIALMFTMASVHFWSFIFALIHWLDTSLWSGATNDTSIGWNTLSPFNATEKSTFLVFDYVIGSLYIMLPLFLTVLMSIAGAKVGDQLATQTGQAVKSTGGKGGSGIGVATKVATKGGKGGK